MHANTSHSVHILGSFKIRGVINQLHDLPPGTGSDKHKIVTASAGNYGKAFGYLASKLGLKGLVLLPDTAPQNRTKVIEVSTGRALLIRSHLSARFSFELSGNSN